MRVLFEWLSLSLNPLNRGRLARGASIWAFERRRPGFDFREGVWAGVSVPTYGPVTGSRGTG